MKASLNMKKTSIALAVCVLCLSSCALLPRDSLPEPSAISMDTYEPVSQAVTVSIEDRWWTPWGDEQLDGLVAEALKASPNMELAKLRVEGAQQIVNAELAGLAPTVGITAQASQQKLSKNYIYVPGMPASTSYGLVGGTLNWSLDIWGKQRQLVSAAKEGVMAANADLLFTRLWLSATVVQAYLEYDMAHQVAELAAQDHESRAQLAFIASERFKVGLVDQATLDARRIELDSAAIAWAQSRQAVKLAQHQLAALVNRGPAWGESLKAPAVRGVLGPLPEVIPADLLARRPDLQALLAQIRAAKLRVDSAKLRYLPDINLQGLIGVQAFDLSRLFQANSQQFSVGPVLNLPIFDGGAIAAQISGREVERNQVIYTYQQALLNALKETADGILRVKTAQQNTSVAEQSEKQAAAILDSATQKRTHGIYSDEQLYLAKLQYVFVKRQLIESQHRHALEGVGLIVALGGPYTTAQPK